MLRQVVTSGVSQVGRVTTDPLGIGTQFLTTAGSVVRMVSPATEPLSPVMTGRSLSVHFDSLTVPVAPLKQASKLVGGKLNDAFVAAVTGGLGRYHRELGEPCQQLRMTMPINIRSQATANLAGNQFAPARFAVPVGITDPLTRMNAGRQIMAAQRREPSLALSDTLASIINRLPATASTGLFGSMLKGIDFVTSNVPGPPVPVYLAGARLETQHRLRPHDRGGHQHHVAVLRRRGGHRGQHRPPGRRAPEAVHGVPARRLRRDPQPGVSQPNSAARPARISSPWANRAR